MCTFVNCLLEFCDHHSRFVSLPFFPSGFRKVVGRVIISACVLFPLVVELVDPLVYSSVSISARILGIACVFQCGQFRILIGIQFGISCG